VVGIGPGDAADRTFRAVAAIEESSVVVGYTKYLSLVEDLLAGKRRISSGMTREVDRCRAALDEAQQGQVVALISSGDAGIYGMAGLALQMAHQSPPAVEVEVIPGVTAASTLAARLGAPLMLDFATISLSDLLVPWETIRGRLEAVAQADMVTVLYNPRSRKRRHHLDEAVEIFLRHRPPTTPVGLGTAVGRPEERVLHTQLDQLLAQEVNMQSTVVIGNSATTVIDRRLVTQRGYQL
jgi:precorrin-3B C17-methyltransferase